MGSEPCLGDIAHRELVSVSERATLKVAIGLFQRQQISALAVQDASGNISGLLSMRDVLGRRATDKVERWMTHRVFALSVRTPVPDAATVMVNSHIHRIFVQDEDGVVGVVTLTDIARLVGERGLGQELRVMELGALSEHVIMDEPRRHFLESLRRAEEHNLVEIFFARFVASSPVVQAHFAKTDFAQQREKIALALSLAAEVAEGKPGAIAQLTEQARRHDRNHLNIKPELYRFWLEALVGAARECDPQFDLFLEAVWRLIMGHVVTHMVNRY